MMKMIHTEWPQRNRRRSSIRFPATAQSLSRERCPTFIQDLNLVSLYNIYTNKSTRLLYNTTESRSIRIMVPTGGI